MWPAVIRNRPISTWYRCWARLGAPGRIIVPGTMVGYDDWWVLPCGKGNEALSPLDVGEGRAHAEMAIKYDVEFMCAAGPCAMPKSSGCDKHNTWGPIFVVLSIGKGSRDARLHHERRRHARLQEKQRPVQRASHRQFRIRPCHQTRAPPRPTLEGSKITGPFFRLRPRARGGCYRPPAIDGTRAAIRRRAALATMRPRLLGRRRRPALVLWEAPKAPGFGFVQGAEGAGSSLVFSS